MKPGDKVVFSGRTGTVVGHMPAGMVDVRMDDTRSVERRHMSRLSFLAKANGHIRLRLNRIEHPFRGPSFRRNPDPEQQEEEKEEAGERLTPEQLAAYQMQRLAPLSPEQQAALKLAREEADKRKDEQQAAYDRTVGRGKDKKSSASLMDALRSRYAVWFTSEDLPRFSSDGSNYCGNPIDGVAYYLLVSQQQTPESRWVTKNEIELFAASRARRSGQKLEEELANPNLMKEFGDSLRRKGGSVTPVVITTAGAARPRPTLGLREEEAVRQKKVGFRSMDTPIPDRDYHLTGSELGSLPRGEGEERLRPDDQVYYRIYTKVTRGEVFLDGFQIYKRRFFRAPEVSDSDAKKYGTLAAAVYNGLVRRSALRGGVSRKVVEQFIRSGGVSVSGQVQMNPSFNLFETGRRGSFLTFGFSAKARSKLYSWVPDNAPVRLPTQEPTCLTVTDQKYLAELKEFRRMLSELKGAFSSVRSLYRGLIDRPEGLGHEGIYRAVIKLVRSFSAVINWNSKIDRTLAQDPNNALYLRLRKDVDSTVLAPTDPNSTFRSIMRSLEESPLFSSMVETGEWKVGRVGGPPGLLPANVTLAVSNKQRKGYEAQILDKRAGIYAYRVKGGKTKPLVTNRETADLFLSSLQSLVMPSQEQLQLVLRGEGEQAERGVATSFTQVEALPSRPGGAAITFFSAEQGETKSIPHPLQDLYGYIRPSLTDDAVRYLAAVMTDANEAGGVRRLRFPLFLKGGIQSKAKPYAELRGDHRRQVRVSAADLSDSAASHYSDVMSQLALGQLPTVKVAQPEAFDFPYDLRHPPQWSVARDQQMDMNWVLGLIVTRVYPAVLQARRGRYAEAGAICRDAILLAILYDLFGGFSFEGPLNPGVEKTQFERLRIELERDEAMASLQARLATILSEIETAEDQARAEALIEQADSIEARLAQIAEQYENRLRTVESRLSRKAAGTLTSRGDLLSMAIAQVRSIESSIQGGESLGGIGERFKAYVTYNPVLFELTRLYWPEGRVEKKALPSQRMVTSLAAGGERPRRNPSAVRPAQKGDISDKPVVFKNLLSQPHLVEQVDEVGRFGHLVQMTQQAMLYSRNVADVDNFLYRFLVPGASASPQMAMSGETLTESGEIVKAADPIYEPFTLSWAIGSTQAEAIAEVNALKAEPLDYIRARKMELESILGEARNWRRLGAEVERGKRLVSRGDFPDVTERMTGQRQPIHERSVMTSITTEEESMLIAKLAAVDQAIRDLDSQIAHQKGR